MRIDLHEGAEPDAARHRHHRTDGGTRRPKERLLHELEQLTRVVYKLVITGRLFGARKATDGVGGPIAIGE